MASICKDLVHVMCIRTHDSLRPASLTVSVKAYITQSIQFVPDLSYNSFTPYHKLPQHAFANAESKTQGYYIFMVYNILSKTS